MRTFELGGEVSSKKPYSTISVKNQIIHTLGGDIEQAYDSPIQLVGGGVASNLVGLAHYAFSTHRHMILDPDTVWLTIEHGLATHIKANAEELRHQFVSFEGKKTISIQRDMFVRGGVNDWEGCFDEFSEKIGEFIGQKKNLIVGNFSTTGLIHRVSSEIVLMDAMSKYFNYEVCTLCHIPIITLTGTVEDWEAIRDKVNAFDDFGLSWWTDHLKPVLDKLVETAKGNFDKSFWKSWYKEGGGSGGPYITGHVNAFFPYIGKDNQRNKCMGTTKSNAFGGGNTLSEYNQSLSKVPFVWNYYGTNLPMEFVGGLIGISQNDDGTVRCEFGWAVRDESVPLENFPLERLVKDMWINHKDGRRGKLKRAEAEHWDHAPDDKQLFEVHIQWEGGKLEKIPRHKFRDLIVKEQSSGDSILEEK